AKPYVAKPIEHGTYYSDLFLAAETEKSIADRSRDSLLLSITMLYEHNVVRILGRAFGCAKGCARGVRRDAIKISSPNHSIPRNTLRVKPGKLATAGRL